MKPSTISISYIDSSSDPDEPALCLPPSSWLTVRPCRPKNRRPGLASPVWPRLSLNRKWWVLLLFESDYDVFQCPCSLKFIRPAKSSIKVSDRKLHDASSVVEKVLHIPSWCHRGPWCLSDPLFWSPCFVLFTTFIIIHYSSCKSPPLKPTIMISIIKWDIV